MLKQQARFLTKLSVLVDAATLFRAFYLAYGLLYRRLQDIHEYAWALLIILPTWLLLLSYSGIYGRSLCHDLTRPTRVHPTTAAPGWSDSSWRCSPKSGSRSAPISSARPAARGSAVYPTPSLAGGNNYHSNTITGADVRFRIPQLRNTGLHGEFSGEDNAGGVWPIVESYVAGLFVPCLTDSCRDDFRLLGAGTELSHR